MLPVNTIKALGNVVSIRRAWKTESVKQWI